MAGDYIKLKDLEVYKLACESGALGWKIYKKLDWREKKINGDQFIRSLDSVGANIAEGYGRFHFLDKVRFYYNARGSLLESIHWLNLLEERGLVGQEEARELREILERVHFKLNHFISATFRAKKNEKTS